MCHICHVLSYCLEAFSISISLAITGKYSTDTLAMDSIAKPLTMNSSRSEPKSFDVLPNKVINKHQPNNT